MKESKDKVTLGVRLRGSHEELKKAVAVFDRYSQIEVLPWRPDGGWPLPLAQIVGEKLLEKYLKRGKRVERLDPFPGGEVVPHFHFRDDVIVLERSEFKKLVGEVATKLATDLVDKVDYNKTVDLMGQFAIDTVPLPE
jgi:hypothetical protein